MLERGDEPKRWLCRIAARYGWFEDPGNGGRGRDEAGGSPGFIVRWARRHIERCDHCRAEEAEWERIVALLRQAERRAAPAGLLERVMAGIALEKAEQAGWTGAAETVDTACTTGRTGLAGETAKRSALRRLWSQDGGATGEGALGLAYYLATFTGGLGGAALFLPQGFGMLQRAVDMARAAGTWWQSAAVQALTVWQSPTGPFSEALQPYAASLWWSVSGALLAAAVVRTAQRLNHVTND